jgi:hypothetical protein
MHAVVSVLLLHYCKVHMLYSTVYYNHVVLSLTAACVTAYHVILLQVQFE